MSTLTHQYEPSDSGSDTEGSEDEASEDEEEDNASGSEAESSAMAGKRKRNGSAGAKGKRRREVDDRVSNHRSLLDLSLMIQPKRLPRAVRDAHYDRIQRYYEAGTHWGMSVAQTIYLLATVLERADNDLLWLAILGITYQYVSARIDRERYDLNQEIFMDEVARLNHEAFGGVGKKEPNPDDRSIARSDELRFMLFRHWNLYDAMLHSGYVAGRMGIWKEKGRKRLQGLLAKMG